VSPQRSNRSTLLEGTLRCLERLPPERVTARAIAEEAGANLASIPYHFGTKDNLITEAVILGLDRWLADITARLESLPDGSPAARYRAANAALESTRTAHTGLARNFLAALAKSQHDPRIRDLLTAGFHRTRPAVASVLGLGSDQPGVDAAALALAIFNGLLFQSLLSPTLTLEGPRLDAAHTRLRTLLPE
jgi:AcrR family transcriptional regulator